MRKLRILALVVLMTLAEVASVSAYGPAAEPHGASVLAN